MAMLAGQAGRGGGRRDLRSSPFQSSRSTDVENGRMNAASNSALRFHEAEAFAPHFGARRSLGGASADCFFLTAQDPAEAAQLVVDLVAQRLPARYGFGV